MTVPNLKLYLKKNLEFPSLDFIWSEEDNHNFFTFLAKNYSEDYLKNNENLLKIKEAFKDYFEPVGYILFQIKNYKIRLKIFPYKKEPEESENIDAIVDIIDENEDLVVNDYNGRSDQILIKDELKRKIFAYVDTLNDEKIHKKELVKFAVREAFELTKSDIVMVKQESIFIKLCEIVKKHEILENEKNSIANRFNGIDEEELSAFNTEHFSSRGDRDFFIHVAKLFVNRYLIEKNISNLEYEKNVFGYIHSIITQQLILTFDDCEEFFKGLSGYVFRIHFEEVFENVAEAILAEVAMSNQYMIDFLKYYSLNIIVINERKYKVPVLEAQNGLKWNVLSMLSIVKLYMVTKSKIKAINYELDNKNDEIETLIIDGLTPVEYNKKHMEDKKRLAKEMTDTEKKLEKYKDSLSLTKDEKKRASLQNDISSIKKNIRLLKEENKMLLSRDINRAKINKYIMLEKEVDSMSRNLKREEKLLEQNEESFKSIKFALVKALISKKQLV
jgi:hypothetical protein